MVHIFRSLPFIADARVRRIASFFEEKTIYTWEKSTTKNEIIKDNDTKSFPYHKDKKSKILKIFLFLLYIFWIPFTILTKAKKNDICVFMDFETIIFGYFAARLKGTKVIFDIVDPISQTKIRIKYLQKMVDKLELYYANKSDLTIIPHECRNEFYINRIDSKILNYMIIENVPFFNKLDSQMTRKFKKANKFNIGYFGTLDYESRGIEWLLDFAKLFSNDINLIIAGQGAMEYELSQINQENVQFLGSFNQNTLPNLYNEIDFTWAYYSPNIDLHKYAAPNKFYEHLHFNCPIITSDIIPQIVDIEQLNSGIFVNINRNDMEYKKEFLEKIKSFKINPQRISDFWNTKYINYYQKKKIELDYRIK